MNGIRKTKPKIIKLIRIIHMHGIMEDTRFELKHHFLGHDDYIIINGQILNKN